MGINFIFLSQNVNKTKEHKHLLSDYFKHWYWHRTGALQNRSFICTVLFIATCYNIKSATVFICYCNDCCRSSESDRHSEHMDNVRLYHQSLQEQTASQSFHSSSAGDINPSSSILFSALRYQFMDTALFNHLYDWCRAWALFLFLQEKTERAWQHSKIFQPQTFNSYIPTYARAGKSQ